MSRHSGRPTLISSGFGAVSFLVTFDDGRIYAQALNGRLTKGDVARLLRTTEDGVAYLAKMRLLKLLGHPDETKQKLFSAADIFTQMQDIHWLGKATDLLYQFVAEKNAAQAKRKNRRVKKASLSSDG